MVSESYQKYVAHWENKERFQFNSNTRQNLLNPLNKNLINQANFEEPQVKWHKLRINLTFALVWFVNTK